MSSQMVIARSPIAQLPPVEVDGGWEVSRRSTRADLTITDLTPLSKVHLRAPKRGLAEKAIGVPFGRAERCDSGTLVIGSGPGEWLVLGDLGNASELSAEWERALSHAASSGEHVTVLDMTHGRAVMRLRGQACALLLAKVCAIDFSGAVTPNGAAFRTSVAKLVTDIVRDDQDSVLSFLVHCERSSGQYLFESIRDAGAEFDIDVQGFPVRG